MPWPGSDRDGNRLYVGWQQLASVRSLGATCRMLFQTKRRGPTALPRSVLQNGVPDGRALTMWWNLQPQFLQFKCYIAVFPPRTSQNLIYFREWVFGGWQDVCHQHQWLEGAGEKGENRPVRNPLPRGDPADERHWGGSQVSPCSMFAIGLEIDHSKAFFYLSIFCFDSCNLVFLICSSNI